MLLPETEKDLKTIRQVVDKKYSKISISLFVTFCFYLRYLF